MVLALQVSIGVIYHICMLSVIRRQFFSHQSYKKIDILLCFQEIKMSVLNVSIKEKLMAKLAKRFCIYKITYCNPISPKRIRILFIFVTHCRNKKVLKIDASIVLRILVVFGQFLYSYLLIFKFKSQLYFFISRLVY